MGGRLIIGVKELFIIKDMKVVMRFYFSFTLNVTIKREGVIRQIDHDKSFQMKMIQHT